MGQKECKKYIECNAEKEAVYKIIVPEWVHVAFKKCIDDVPAADVRSVVHGRWIHTTQPMGWRDEECAECSVCGEDFVLDEWAMDDFTNLMHFCPNCGADMREDVNEE